MQVCSWCRCIKVRPRVKEQTQITRLGLRYHHFRPNPDNYKQKLTIANSINTFTSDACRLVFSNHSLYEDIKSNQNWVIFSIPLISFRTNLKIQETDFFINTDKLPNPRTKKKSRKRKSTKLPHPMTSGKNESNEGKENNIDPSWPHELERSECQRSQPSIWSGQESALSMNQDYRNGAEQVTGGKTSVTLLHGAQENLSSKADMTEPSSSDRHFRPTRESDDRIPPSLSRKKPWSRDRSVARFLRTHPTKHSFNNCPSPETVLYEKRERKRTALYDLRRQLHAEGTECGFAVPVKQQDTEERPPIGCLVGPHRRTPREARRCLMPTNGPMTAIKLISSFLSCTIILTCDLWCFHEPGLDLICEIMIRGWDNACWYTRHSCLTRHVSGTPR